MAARQPAVVWAGATQRYTAGRPLRSGARVDPVAARAVLDLWDSGPHSTPDVPGPDGHMERKRLGGETSRLTGHHYIWQNTLDD